MQQASELRSIDAGQNTSSSYIELALQSVALSSSGLYACQAENLFGNVEATVRIDVDGRPFIRQMTSPRRLLAGSQLEWLNCPYGGFPIDTVTWDKDGENNWLVVSS